MIRQGRQKLGLFPLLVATFAIQAALSGLNLSVGLNSARLIQPIGAAILPSFCFVAFNQLRPNEPARLSYQWLHLLPVCLVAVLVAFWRAPIDIALFAIYLGYGLALLRVARRGPDELAAVRISDGWSTYNALVAMAVLFVITAFLDAIVALDFTFGDGQQARTLLTIASVLWLVVAGYAATVADNARPDTEAAAVENSAVHGLSTIALAYASSAEEDTAAISRLEALMRQQHLYRDPDLTLDRLARRAGIPARQISSALNRIYGRNISQIVNEYRVSDAKRQLTTTADSVTVIMLQSGFGTKSNFNREFLRVTGMTPSTYRRVAGETSVVPEAKTDASISSRSIADITAPSRDKT